MKTLKAALLSLMLILFLSSSFTYTEAASETDQESQFRLWLVLRLRDYETNLPISNTSITADIALPFPPWQKHVGPLLTNETGVAQVFLEDVILKKFTQEELQGMSTNALRTVANNMGIPNWGNKNQLISRILNAQEISVWKTLFVPPTLRGLELSNNYTLIKALNTFIEDTDYEAEYTPNITRYAELRINLAKNFGNSFFVEGDLWVLKGKLVGVSDCNPVTGELETLHAKPAVKTDIESKTNEYETYYLFPLNYEVTIFHKVESWIEYLSQAEEVIPPLTVTVNENTSVINWMSHAAEVYEARQTHYTDKELKWLASSGYPLDREIEECQAIKSLLSRVLELYRKEEYIPALGGAKIAEEKLEQLNKWLSDLKVLALLNTVAICLLAYGLASLLSNFFFEEPSENKIRLVSKVLMFSLLMLTFSLTHPSLKIAFAYIIGSRSISLPISLLGCFIIGGLIYFFIQLLSVRKRPITDLAVQLGVRSLKRRRSRSILTLITITIMVSSAIIFVNISMNRSTRIKSSWKGTDIPGVLIEPDTTAAPLSEYDINWTRAQDWCKDFGYTEGIRFEEMTPEGITIDRYGFVLDEENRISVDNIVGIDPTFFEKHYNLSGRVRSFWDEFSVGKTVVILPTTLGVLTNKEVTLIIEELWTMPSGDVKEVEKTLGEFRVIGSFDPVTSFVNLTKIDNTPLFEDTLIALVPIKSIEDSAITVSEVTILTKENYDPVDVAEELAYTLAATTVANKDGLAQRIKWSVEFSIAGLIPYIPPLVIASLMMYTTMVSVYEERKREFMTLATLGLDPGNTFQVFLVEALLLGLMGTFFGFFGSYMLGAALFYLSRFLEAYGVPVFSLSFVHWSMPSILVAFLTGVVMVFLGGYIPAVRTQGLSLMGRVKKRQLVGELISEGDVTSFTLPIRETIQNSEMLYTYVRETLGEIKRSRVDSHSIKGEIYRDGTFKVSFTALGDERSVTVPCEIKGIKEGELLVPVIEFPTSYKEYSRIREILRDLEEYMIGFSAWKELQLKMTIIREAPKRRKTTEEILADIKDVIGQIKDCNKKLKILEGQRGTLSEEVYNEFKQKYIDMIEEKSKNLRSMTINLEPYHKQLQEEISKIEVEVERITTSYNLGEITEEEYVKTCGPLQGRLAELKDKVQEIEEIFDFLKKPIGAAYE